MGEHDIDREALIAALSQAAPAPIASPNGSAGVPAHWLTLRHYVPLAPEVQRVVDDIYRLAGVGIEWEDGVDAQNLPPLGPNGVMLRHGNARGQSAGHGGFVPVDRDTRRGSVITLYPEVLERAHAGQRGTNYDVSHVYGWALAHELGHTLGLGHDPSGRTLMRERISRDDISKRRPEDWRLDDKQAALIRQAIIAALEQQEP